MNLNIAYNKKTKEMIGYSKPDKDGFSILVIAYAVDDLEKKFKKLADKETKRLKIMKSGLTAAKVYGDMIDNGERIAIEGIKSNVDKMNSTTDKT